MREEFYLDERQRKKRRRILKLKIYGGIAAFFILMLGAIYAVVYSPLFRIKQINIETSDVPNINGDNLKTSDVQELINSLKDFFANQSKIARFLGAENILIWNVKKIDQFPKKPEIAEISIEKNYFEREIKINIKERKRFGVWCFRQTQINADETRTNAESISENQRSNQRQSVLSKRDSTSSCVWFDKNGVIFSEAPMVEGNLINKVGDFSGRSLKLGDLVLEEKLLSNLFKIFEVLEKSGLKIKSLKLEKIELQEIFTDSSPVIYFSLRIDPAFVLPAINSLRNIGLEKIEYIDLRVENRAYYKTR